MILGNGDREYEIGDKVAETPVYRLYLCQRIKSKEVNLLQIAADVSRSGDLDRAAYILDALLQHAKDLEEKYDRVKKDPNNKLNYQLCLPRITDTFVSDSQGSRRIHVVGFHGVDDARRMVPLHFIVDKDKRRVDARTSVWILGKLLKILAFAHSAGVSIGDISPGNILIEPDKHYVVVFNWTQARIYPEGLPDELVRQEIALAAESVLKVLGSESGLCADDGLKQFEPYFQYVAKLAAEGGVDAVVAHREFYELADALWPRGYHPFTSLPLEG